MTYKENIILELNEMKGFIRGSIRNKNIAEHYVKTISNTVTLLEGDTIMGKPSTLNNHTKKIRSLI